MALTAWRGRDGYLYPEKPGPPGPDGGDYRWREGRFFDPPVPWFVLEWYDDATREWVQVKGTDQLLAERDVLAYISRRRAA
jgi:hypothetical protein